MKNLFHGASFLPAEESSKFIWSNEGAPQAQTEIDKPINPNEKEDEWKEGLVDGTKSVDELVSKFFEVAEEHHEDAKKQAQFVKKNIESFFKKTKIGIPSESLKKIQEALAVYEGNIASIKDDFRELSEEYYQYVTENDYKFEKFESDGLFGLDWDNDLDNDEYPEIKQKYEEWSSLEKEIGDMKSATKLNVFKKRELKQKEGELKTLANDLKILIKEKEQERLSDQQGSLKEALSENLVVATEQEQVAVVRDKLFSEYEANIIPKHISQLKLSSVKNQDGDINMEALKKRIDSVEKTLAPDFEEILDYLSNSQQAMLFSSSEAALAGLTKDGKELFVDASEAELSELMTSLNNAISMHNLKDMYEKMEMANSTEALASSQEESLVPNNDDIAPVSETGGEVIDSLEEKSSEEIYKLIENISPDSLKEDFDPQNYEKTAWNEKITEKIGIKNTRANIEKMQSIIGVREDGAFGPYSLLALYKFSGGAITEKEEWGKKFDREYIDKWDQKSHDLLAYDKEAKKIPQEETLKNISELRSMETSLRGITKEKNLPTINITTDLKKVGSVICFGIDYGETSWKIFKKEGSDGFSATETVVSGSLKESVWGTPTASSVIKSNQVIEGTNSGQLTESTIQDGETTRKFYPLLGEFVAPINTFLQKNTDE